MRWGVAGFRAVSGLRSVAATRYVTPLREGGSLPAELLYTTIQDVGLADSTELVQLASPAQFRTFVDLAGWKRDRIEPHAVLTWLRAARGDASGDVRREAAETIGELDLPAAPSL